MAWNMFTPKPGRFGTATVLCVSGQIGAANYLGGATPLTANTTTTFRMPTPPFKCRFKSIAVSCSTVAVDADGTVLATAQKYNGSAQVALTGNIDLEALTARQITTTQSNASDPNRIFNGTSDALEVNVVNNSAAIDTQPAGLVFTAAFELLQ